MDAETIPDLGAANGDDSPKKKARRPSAVSRYREMEESIKGDAKQDIDGALENIKAESRRYSNSGEAPWLGADGRTIVWSPARIFVAKIMRARRFETFMGLVICFNLGLIVYETDYEAQCYPGWYDKPEECPYQASKVLSVYLINLVLLLIYTAEAALRIYADRAKYFQARWNCLDFMVVLTGWISEVLGGVVNIAFLRIFRVARLSRAFRLLLSIRELYMLITGLASSMRAIFFGVILLLGMLAVWSIILVDFVHPENTQIAYDGCDRCGRGYSTVYNSMLTLFQQIVAGDSWGLTSVPLIERNSLFFILLVLIVVSVSLGVMNLILAVIVESAAEAREADIAQKIKTRLRDQEKSKIDLLQICASMDKDDSQSISMDEMNEAWRESPRFRDVMMALEVRREELPTIFNIIDANGSGDVDYKEFVDKLYDLHTSDVRLKLEMFKLDTASRLKRLDQKAVENAATLVSHTNLLASIDSKLEQVLSRSFANDPVSPPDQSPSIDPQSAQNASQTSPDQLELAQPLSATNAVFASAGTPMGGAFNKSAVSSSDGQAKEISDELGQLRDQTNMLGTAEADLLKRAVDQIQVLAQHTQTLTILHKIAGTVACPDHTAMQLRKVQGHVQMRASALRDLQRWVDEDAVALCRGAQLMDSLASCFSIPVGLGLANAALAEPIVGSNAQASIWRQGQEPSNAPFAVCACPHPKEPRVISTVSTVT
eukprot:TRINITY_DN6230_c0_g2_i1.p1 TRINITY_DN6230_c0_g2~~TRINITY_DN6230_c0_g2_i1.p1  ORF type:complete len:717 (+),score=83.72 TRINITY_DN6230_c0_g2_i1:49-2199(+)